MNQPDKKRVFTRTFSAHGIDIEFIVSEDGQGTNVKPGSWVGKELYEAMIEADSITQETRELATKIPKHNVNTY